MSNTDCGGNVYDCMTQLKQILILTEKWTKLAEKIYTDKWKLLDKIDKGYFGAMDDQNKTYTKLRACHQFQQESKSEELINLYYPHETTYQYITGHRENNPNNYDGFKKPYSIDVKRIIDESIQVGVDPFAVMGMTMMERGGGKMKMYARNMHDSRISMVLGCKNGKFASNGLPQVAKHSSRIEELASSLGYEKEKSSKSRNPYARGHYPYSCVGRAKDFKYIDDHKGFESFKSLKSARKAGRTCCIESEYDLGWDNRARKLTTYLYFKQMQNLDHYNPMAGKKNQRNIVNRLNTFWGASHTTGTFPSYRISPFRVGLSTYKDPNYARQIMDYSLNTFMRSGQVMKYVKQAEKKYGKKLKSFLCVGKEPGAYSIDSDHYFNQIKASTRLAPIKAKYDQGKNWSQLGIKYQSVLLQEFTYYRGKIDKESASLKKIKKYLTSDELKVFNEYAKQLYEYRNSSLRRGKKTANPLRVAMANKIFDKVYKIYFSKPELYEYRKLLVNAAREDSGLSWERSTDKSVKHIKNATMGQKHRPHF